MLFAGAHDSGRYMNRIERPTSTKLLTSSETKVSAADAAL